MWPRAMEAMGRREERVKTLVIIPAYNEEGTIQEVVMLTQREIPAADIVVVNDGSSDKDRKSTRLNSSH